MPQDSDSHYIGHRQRLRERFLSSPSSLPEYEIMELILFWSVNRKDVKPLAKTLLQHFGNLAGVLYADKDKFQNIPEVNERMLANFLVIREIIARILKSNITEKNILSSWSAVVEYLKATMGHNKTESFRTLFLNKKNVLIADELQNVGTIDQTPVYPREVLKRALFYEAGSIILVHNHPSGNPEPSKADIALTNRIVEVCKTVGIIVHDHVIVTQDNFFSFKSHMLL
jgi:DNA repair protein RadC